MNCEKCGGHVDSSGKCIICGYDRKNEIEKIERIEETNKNKRSKRFIAYVIYNILFSLFALIMGIIMVFQFNTLSGSLLLLGAIFSIIIAVNLFFYKKWAYKITFFIVFFNIFSGFISAGFSGLFMGIVGLGLLFLVLKKERDNFLVNQ